MNCIEADNIIYLQNRKMKMSEDLMSKVTELQNEVKQLKNALDGVVAQLEAHKQMLNESLNTILQLRTHNIMLQKNLNETASKCKGFEDEAARLTKELEEAKKPPTQAVSSDT
jgi:chromosome segregation ATPase